MTLPFKIGGVRGSQFERPPELGADTDNVLGDLGYDDGELAAFRAAGAIA